MLLKDRKIVVTGLANEKSISWGVAKSLHRQGARLIFTYRKAKSMRKIHKLLLEHDITPVCIVHCDAMDDESMHAAFQEIGAQAGSLHGLVHSIAYADAEELQKEYAQVSREGYLLAQNASAYSLIAMARYASNLMTEGGSIVTQSYLGSQRAVRHYGVMGAAKAALESSVRYLADDLGKRAIRVNAVSSGPILTSASSAIPGIGEKLANAAASAPLRRTVDQEEVGDASAFLLSSLSRGITGEIIHVDAGHHLVGI